MKHSLFIFLSCIHLCLSAAEVLPDTVAVFGKTEIKKERFKNFRLPNDPAERRKQLKKLIDTEIYITVIRQLLSLSAIAPDENTARRYIDFRKVQCGGNFPETFRKSLESQIKKSDFQLRSALYFTFYAAAPAAVEPSIADISRHYDLNREKFHIATDSKFGIFRAGNNDEKGRKNAAVILSRMRQGEEFDALAGQFDPAGMIRSSGGKDRPELTAAVKNMKEGETRAVPTGSGIYMIKMISKGSRTAIPLHESAPYIREMLSGMMLKNALEQYISEVLAKNPVKYFF